MALIESISDLEGLCQVFREKQYFPLLKKLHSMETAFNRILMPCIDLKIPKQMILVFGKGNQSIIQREISVTPLDEEEGFDVITGNRPFNRLIIKKLSDEWRIYRPLRRSLQTVYAMNGCPAVVRPDMTFHIMNHAMVKIYHQIVDNPDIYVAYKEIIQTIRTIEKQKFEPWIEKVLRDASFQDEKLEMIDQCHNQLEPIESRAEELMTQLNQLIVDFEKAVNGRIGHQMEHGII